MFGGGKMFRNSASPGEQDAGSGNNEEIETSTTGPSQIASDESQNGEQSRDSEVVRSTGSGVKAKRKKKRRKGRSINSPKDKTSRTPLESNDKDKEKSGGTKASKRKRNGRLVRLVSIDSKKKDLEPQSTAKTTSVPPLPRNQYATTLRRRAVRKQDDSSPHDSDEYGDISLGMKLIVAGGRVIVQSLNSLRDGLASPAQLAGVVQRGDVLMAIGNLSLANLPIDQLMQGLKPLSTPDSGGLYERCLDLRFEAGAGLELLISHEKERARWQEKSAEEAMLFPMVDQLSGAPLVPEYNVEAYRDQKLTIETDNDENMVDAEEAKDNFPAEDIILSDSKTLDEVLDKFSLNFDSLISTVLAKERNSDRDRYESTYFDLREGISDLLRTTLSMEESEKNNRERMLSKVERLELGRKIMQITKALELNLEDIDKGREARPQKNWSSGLSVRSGASSVVKRHYNTDGTITSVPSSYNSPFELTVDEESIGSDDSIDDADADKILLGLAARDTIWRKLVITMLNKAADETKNRGEEKSKEESSPNGAIDFKQLGYFLFREKDSRDSKRKVNSVALPPQEITRVLFDLATFIATTSHDDVTVFGGSSKMSSNISTLRSVASKAGMRGRASVRGDFLLAKRFVLDEALPHWLKSFEPLKLDQRIIIWPGQRNGDSYDVVNQRKKKGLRDSPIADEENDLKSETCFLVTYFCTEKIIGSEPNEELSTTNENSFILSYGAYLQIHTCLSFASFVKDEAAISDLLQVASDDPSHRDTMKEIQKSDKILYYDSSKLSAVLKSLGGIRFDTNEERRKLLLDLCVSGYPDIQPWQVRTACLSPQPGSDEETRNQYSKASMEDVYYSYLCQLLNPLDGHEGAREDSSLLKEFCDWSIGAASGGEITPSRMENFLNIASPSSTYHASYRRDLVMLLDLSSSIENHSLSLDLVNEIIGNGKLASSNEASRRTLDCLRKIGSVSVVHCSKASTETMGFDNLKRVLSLFEKMSTKNSPSWQNSLSFPDEIFTLLKQWKTQKESSGDDASMYQFIDFVINVSSEPSHVVKALFLWSSHHNGDALFSRLEHLLRRGIHFAVANGELSGTLLRLKYARTAFRELDSTRDQSRQTEDAVSIWESMGTGNVSMEK